MEKTLLWTYIGNGSRQCLFKRVVLRSIHRSKPFSFNQLGLTFYFMEMLVIDINLEKAPESGEDAYFYLISKDQHESGIACIDVVSLCFPIQTYRGCYIRIAAK